MNTQTQAEQYAEVNGVRIRARASNHTSDLYLSVATDVVSDGQAAVPAGTIIGRASYDGFESPAKQQTFADACARARALSLADFADEWEFVTAVFGG